MHRFSYIWSCKTQKDIAVHEGDVHVSAQERVDEMTLRKCYDHEY